MKGILLAGGTGSRLYPLTRAVCKQLLPVYDKPMVYYPLSTLMLAGVRDIVVITRPEDQGLFRALLGDGGQWGLRFTYVPQARPEGIAQAFLLAEPHVRGKRVCLVLGDNVLYGAGLQQMLTAAARRDDGAVVFGYQVRDPHRYGVVSFDASGRPDAIEEKPERPRSSHAVIGLYMYDQTVTDIARDLRPSARGELEITDVNRHYLAAGRLHVERLGRGFAWLDMGTPDSLTEAAQFIAAIHHRQSLKIGCVEEIAWRQGWIDDARLERLADAMAGSEYGAYLRALLPGGG